MTNGLIETAKKYIKFEILEQDHNINDRPKQADYCGEQLQKCFNALEGTIGHVKAINLINKTSEQFYNEIEKKALRL